MSNGLSQRSVFGVSSHIANNIAFCDQTTVLYSAGHNLVVYSILEKKQRFIQGDEKGEGITAIALCPSTRFVAIAECADQPFVLIYDVRTLRKRKSLHLAEKTQQSREYTSMCFSHDSALLITQGGAPDWTLRLWSWSKARQVATFQGTPALPVHSLSFSPIDASLACANGTQFVQFLRIKDEKITLVAPPRLKGHTYTTHTWLKQPEDHLVVGTESGELLLFQAGEYTATLESSQGEGQGLKITALLSFSQGFVAGLVDGNFRLYVLQNNPPSPAQLLTLSQSWKIDTVAQVTSLALCPSEDRLCAITADRQLHSVSISSQIIKGDDVKPLLAPFHAPGTPGGSGGTPGGITGLDACIRKPLVVTCGVDRTVRIWDYATSTLEVWKTFAEEAYSAAFHPSGLHVAVGFADKLRLMNILMDDIRTFFELPIKACREVKFSNGGHILAAVNGNVISLYDFLTRTKLADLRGHNSKVRYIYWGEHDYTLISCGQDGAVYQWEVDDCKRTGEFVQKGTIFTCALSTGDSIFAVGSDHMLKELEMPDLQVVKELDCGVGLGLLAVGSGEHLMFVGTAEPGKPASVRAYTFPLTGEFLEYPCMGAPVSRMCVTNDDHFLLVSDEAGCLFTFDVRGRQEKERSVTMTSTNAKLMTGEMAPLPYSEEILVTRTDLEEKNTLRLELKNKVDELALHNEYQLRLKDMNYSESIKEMTEKFTLELEKSKHKFEMVRQEKNDSEVEYEERLRNMDEKQQHELQELEGAYQQKIVAEVERFQQLVQERNIQQERWDEQQQLLQSTHDRYVVELTADFEQKLEEDRQLRQQLMEEKEELEKEFDETKRQLEDDIDTEIENLRSKFEAQLSAEREATLRFKGENGIMRKKFTVLKKDIEDQAEEIRALHEKEKGMKTMIKGLQAEIAVHKREIKARDDTIGEKEKKMYELKKKNQELEKFKFVLDYKIKELKRQIEPRETKIARMKEQIKDMDRELEQFHNSNAQLDILIGELREKIDSLQAEIRRQRRQIADQERVSRRFKKDLYTSVQQIQNPKQLVEHVKALYQEHVNLELPKNEMDANVQHEYVRHKEYLERSLSFLKEKFNTDMGKHRADNLNVMQDNMLLIKEINMQREQNKGSKRVLQAQINVLKRFGVKRLEAQSLENKLKLEERPETLGEDPIKVMEYNRAKIKELRELIAQLEASMMVANRTYSASMLPPLDGVDPQGSVAVGP